MKHRFLMGPPLVALACGMAGCVPYPTIERAPEPAYLGLRATDPAQRNDPALRPATLRAARDPQDPLYDPHRADDLWYRYAENGVWGLTPPPRPQEQAYWHWRAVQEGQIHPYVWSSAVASDPAACRDAVREGVGPDRVAVGRDARCRNLTPQQQAQLLEEGLAWRRQWLLVFLSKP